MTSASLADTLTHRFGAEIARAVVSALSMDGAADATVDLELVQRAIGMALDAELLIAGASFAAQAPISALADTPAFRRVAEVTGVRPDTLDAQQRLRIDAAFARRWRARVGACPVAGDPALAQTLMAEVLLNESY